MAFYPNPNGIPAIPPFGRKGLQTGPRPDQNAAPGGDGNPPDSTSSEPLGPGRLEGHENGPAPATGQETEKAYPTPDRQEEGPTFVSLFANLVGMRTPMAPEAPGTSSRGPEGAPEADQEETP